MPNSALNDLRDVAHAARAAFLAAKSDPNHRLYEAHLHARRAYHLALESAHESLIENYVGRMVSDDEGGFYSQVLRVEIDGTADCFDRRHTPGICETLRDVADELERCGIQRCALPAPIHGNGEVVGRVSLIEYSEKAPGADAVEASEKSGREASDAR